MVRQPGPLQPDRRRGRGGARASPTPTCSRATASPTRCPTRSRRSQASGRLDAKLTGANPIDVLVEFPPGAVALRSRDARTSSPRCMPSWRRQAGLGNVWSLETLRRWLAEKAGKSDVATLSNMSTMLPNYLMRRFIAEKQDAVVVSGRIPDKDASQLLPVVDQLDNEPRRRAGRASRLHDRGDGPRRRSRRATAPSMIEQAQPRPDDRVPVRRRLHRPGVPLASW